MAEPALNLSNIQGNILAGFFKDYQAFLFFQIPVGASARGWLAKMVSDVSTTEKVLRFNKAFKLSRERQAGRESRWLATIWVNLAFTHSGLAKLGTSQTDLDAFPNEFREGMRRRAGLLGDAGESAPEKWIPPLRDQEIHGIVLVAADRAADCDAELRRQRTRLERHGLKPLYVQRGKAREGDQRGHEHFGFKDGISQPGIRGVTPVSNPKEPNQGDPGQDLIQPGEFVLGYPTERSPAVIPSPAWAADGSYLVFRRLRQDVQAFGSFVKRQAAEQHLTADLMAAKLVGRYRSGAPLQGAKDQPTDPGKQDRMILSDARINDFEYGGDPDGQFVPRAAHIRKVYSRDQAPPGEGEARGHRLLRRGIPFGESFRAGAPAGSPESGDVEFPNDRGLLFLCYQSSIVGQFEYVQGNLVNNPDFPQPGDGVDPLISQAAASREFLLPGGVRDHVTLMQRWVTTTGGDYFFSPSISALRELAAEQREKGRPAMAEGAYMKAFRKFVATVWASDRNLHDPQISLSVANPQNIPHAPAHPNKFVQGVRDAAGALSDSLTKADANKSQTLEDDIRLSSDKLSDAWRLLLHDCGVDVPPDRSVHVHRNSAYAVHYVIPEEPDPNAVRLEDTAEQAIEAMCCAC